MDVPLPMSAASYEAVSSVTSTGQHNVSLHGLSSIPGVPIDMMNNLVHSMLQAHGEFLLGACSIYVSAQWRFAVGQIVHFLFGGGASKVF